MVRISIPNLPIRPAGPPNALTRLPLADQAKHLGEFLAEGRGQTLVITGAGVSVDSGIRAYRGKEGSYSNPNYQPIFFGQLVEDTPRGQMFRRRYWARSFLGYPPVRDAQPNPNHIYLASLQALGLAPHLITQNVDNLHRKALARVQAAVARNSPSGSSSPTSPLPFPSSSGSGPTGSPSSSTSATHIGPHLDPSDPVLELHGTLARVHCMAHYHEQTRDAWQMQLAEENPVWNETAKMMEETGLKPRTNPDGDVELPGADYTHFTVPTCAECTALGEDHSVVKPNVIFFGETLPVAVKDQSFNLVHNASRLLVLGTSLATYSAFRLIKAAREAGKPVLMISQGPSRADDTEGVDKMDTRAGPVMRAFLDQYLETHSGPQVQGVLSVLDSGIVKSLPADDPRAVSPSS